MAATAWTDAQIARAKERKYVRDWRGRFSRVAGTRAKLHRPHVNKPHVKRPHVGSRREFVYQELAMAAKRVEPPTWDKIKGDNAKRDGLKLYKLKKAGKFPTNVEFYKEADRLHREFRKAHPNGNFASKNQIANAAYRYEWEETGTVHYLEWPGETAKKAAPAKKVPTPKVPPKPPARAVDKTKGGITMTTRKADAEAEKAKRAALQKEIEAKIRAANGGLLITNTKSPYHGQGRNINIEDHEYNVMGNKYKQEGEKGLVVTWKNPKTRKWEKIGTVGSVPAAEKMAIEHYKAMLSDHKDKVKEAAAGWKETPFHSMTGSQLRKRLRDVADSTSEYMDQINKLKPGSAEFERIRAEARKVMDEMLKIDKRLETMKGNFDRPLQAAHNLDELVEIMQDRHPSMIVDNFKDKVEKAREEVKAGWIKRGVEPYRVRHLIADDALTLKAAKQTFLGLDEMMTKYPTIKLYQFNCHVAPTHDKESVGASCSRGHFLSINMNPFQLVNVNEAMRRQKNNVHSGWHPKNHEKRPYANNIIHEFGHAVDWRANIWPDNANSADMNKMIDDNSAVRRKQISKILTDIYFKRVGSKAGDARELLDWLHATKEITGYSFDVDENGRTIIPRILDDDELLAEAFTDVEVNGSEATEVNRALHKMMMDNYRKRK